MKKTKDQSYLSVLMIGVIITLICASYLAVSTRPMPDEPKTDPVLFVAGTEPGIFPEE